MPAAIQTQALPRFISLFQTFLIATVIIVALSTNAGAQEIVDEQAVKESVTGLYQALSNKDAGAFSQFLMPQGFTELNPDWPGVRRLDMKIFNAIFQSEAKIDLRVTNMQVQKSDTKTAVVTGYRVGTITAPGAPAILSRLALSMIWAQHLGQWKLIHVHLSEEKSQ